MRQMRKQHDDTRHEQDHRIRRARTARRPRRTGSRPTSPGCPPVGQRALQPALARQPTGADRPYRVVDLVRVLVAARPTFWSNSARIRAGLVVVDEPPKNAAPTVATESMADQEDVPEPWRRRRAGRPWRSTISTDADPRSGWMMHQADRDADDDQPADEPAVVRSRRSAPRPGSVASISTVVNLANSAGWKLNGPRSNEMRSSPAAMPSSTSITSSTIVARYRNPGAVLATLVVDRHHDDHRRRSPTMAKMTWRVANRYGSSCTRARRPRTR